MCKDLVIAIDGNSLLYRAYYALTEMTSRKGEPTGALHGFLSMLLSLKERKPKYVLVAFDVHQPTFRHLKYDGYKGGRPETPVDLVKQFSTLKTILNAMHICILECPGYEADDILGTVSRIADGRGIRTLIVTGDRDALQLANESTHILLTKKGVSETIEYTPELLMEQFGLSPDHMKDLKALMGDHSDNIPGIPGVGEKTALKLLSEYGSLESVIEHSNEIKGKLGEKVRDNTEQARFSYWLGTICTNAPLEFSIEDALFDEGRLWDAEPVLRELDLRSVISKLPKSNTEAAKKAATSFSGKTVTVSCEDELAKIVEHNQTGKLALVHSEGGIAFAFDNDTNYVLKSGDTLFDTGIEIETFYRTLSEFLSNEKNSLIVFDLKDLLHKLKGFGIELCCQTDDLMIAEYLLDSVRPISGIVELVSRYPEICDTVSACCLFSVCKEQKQRLSEIGLSELYDKLELPLCRVLFSMENDGVYVNDSALSELGHSFTEKTRQLETKIFQIAGEEFNILSPKQLGAVLFEKLGLPAKKKTKSGYSTDADVLEKLKDKSEIIQPVLDYRFLTKLKSTYVDGLTQLKCNKDGRIHSTFNQCLTATGRLSSSEPNLQNIPARTEIGREIRKAFEAKPGYLLVDGDYSQIELRLLAHISGDSDMIAGFNSGEDIHARTASEVFHVPLSEVTSEQRSAAKAVNFGIVYGISVYGLSENLNIPVSVAKDYIDRYFERYPSISSYMKKCVSDALECGYASTLYGRRRALPELKSSNFNVRSFGERVAMNMPIQGTAADVIKIAMLNTVRMLEQSGIDARLILQVHDELILEVKEEDAIKAQTILKNAMESAVDLSVPLTVEVKTGKSWYETK